MVSISWLDSLIPQRLLARALILGSTAWTTTTAPPAAVQDEPCAGTGGARSSEDLAMSRAEDLSTDLQKLATHQKESLRAFYCLNVHQLSRSSFSSLEISGNLLH